MDTRLKISDETLFYFGFDQLVQEMELVRLRMVRMSSQIPDTLYMIDDTPTLPPSSQPSSTANDLDVVTGAVPG